MIDILGKLFYAAIDTKWKGKNEAHRSPAGLIWNLYFTETKLAAGKTPAANLTVFSSF